MKLSARIVSTVKEIICPDSGCYDTEGSEIDCPKCYDDQGSETNCPKYYDNQGNEIVCPNCYDSEDLMFPENGYSDWRLPDSNEVLTIFDHSKNSLNEVFSGSPSSCWSSTTRIYDEGHAWRAYSGGAVTYTTKSANDYAFAVIFTSGNTQTLPVACARLMTEYGIVWGQVMTTGTILVAPVLFLGIIIRKYLVRGLTMGAIR